jgi:UDP-4-amino-4,6-dideoxy-N-acetyl-beta-L-altrosamine transaminase
MIPYGRQSIDNKDIKEAIKVLKSEWITQGPNVFEFEEALAKYCGARFAVSCCNGTAALHMAYLASGLKKGDEVITTPNTFVATANMILAAGAKPVFCDIRLDTFNIDEDKIEKLITKKTKAVVVVHFAGQPCAMDKINKLAKKHKLLVIEDACHALGASFKKSRIGECRYSNFTVFSFHPVKSIATGEGGAVLTNDKKHYKKLLALRSHGIHKDKKGKNIMDSFGYNYRLTDFQAVLGISQLKKIDVFLKKRNQIAQFYAECLKGVKEIDLPFVLSENYSAWHIYVIRLRSAKIRDKLTLYLKANGIGVNFHYPAVYFQPYYESLGYGKIKLLNEEKYQNTCLTLPCFPKLKREEIKYICRAIKNFLNYEDRKINP